MLNYVLFILVIIFAVGAWYLLRRDTFRVKKKYQKEAHRLLGEDRPDPKAILKTMKLLHIYGGRNRKDTETRDLIKHLNDKLEQLPK